MARSDRLLRLLQAFRVLPTPVTATRLAQETGVSPRSIYRDINSLRAAGALIDGERGYGYRLVEDRALPPQTFSRAELEALSLGLNEVRHFGDAVLASAAGAALAKIAASLPTELEQQLFHAVSQVRRQGTRYAEAPGLDVIRQGCWREQAVEIGYVDKDGKASQRRILPLAIVYLDQKLMVLAWCCLRHAFRIFDTSRISGARLAEERFRPRRAGLLRDYVALLQAERGGPTPPAS